SQDQVENCQQEFAKMLGLAPSTVSHHFKELRNAGLVKVQRQGKNIMVQVDKEVLETIKSLF
ncbi:MAG: helix-turn-helix domain-containing protein, partial [Desulfobacterales bacterium]|nr:helix-turn-helix domain-containing protein [Desulfobacterales bacterium]